MATERKNRLSPEGRLRCSESGRAQIANLIEARRAAVPLLRQAVNAFEADLSAELGPTPTAAQRALILAATASYAALFSVSQRLRSTHRPRILALTEQVVPLTGALNRSLRLLGVAPASADADSATEGGGLAEYLARRGTSDRQQENGNGAG